jgi:uncharacterized membrane protein
MDWEDIFPWIALAAFGGIGLSLKLVFDERALRLGVAALGEQIRALDRRLIRLETQIREFLPPSPAEEPAVAPTPDEIAVPEEAVIAPAEVAAALEAPERVPDLLLPAAGPGPGWERALAENWLVWLGGLTLALGGAFLVKLSIDYGLLTPAVRVALGLLLGIGMAIGADRLARSEPSGDAAPERSAPAPQALAAAGAAIVFASLYAAYELYDLIPAAAAFPLLAATAAATVVMALRHGAYVAALGIVGAYAVPLLVATGGAQALPLFAYLAVVTAAALAVLRHRAWWWLAWFALGGDIFWTLLWLGEMGERPQTPIVGAFLLLLLAMFAAFRRGMAGMPFLAGPALAPMVGAVVRVAFWAIAFVLLVLVHTDGFAAAALAAVFLAALFTMWFAWHDPDLDDIAAAAGALLLLVLATWNLPLPHDQADPLVYLRQPVAVGDFTTAAILAATLLGLGGFLALQQTPRPGRWAALSAAAPLLILVIAYWRLEGFTLELGWTATALAVAGLELWAAAAVARRRSTGAQGEMALAAYAVGVLGGTILAATFALTTAWLSVALALHLPAMGWVEGRFRLRVLRHLALGVAVIVLVRLAANPYVLDYPLAATPIFNWMLYGYGVPAAAFIIATRQFGSRADDLLVGVLEAGATLFTTLLLTLELRHLLFGRLDAPLGDLGSDAVQALLWLVLAAVLLWLGERRARPVLRWGGVILFVVATVQTVLWQVVVANPLWTGDPVGRLMFFDALSLAYGLPAVLYAAIAGLRVGPIELRRAARSLAAGFGFVWISLEIRHAFRGENLIWGECSQGEWYAYSAAWLALAAIGLAVGLLRGNEWLRRAALAALALVVAKVFLFDMAALAGVLRALSFLGLGAVLVAIGYAYRRLHPVRRE